MRPTESSDCRCLLQRSCRTRCCLSLSMPPSTSMTFFVSPVPCEHSLSQRRQSHSARSPAWKRATLGPSVPTRNANYFLKALATCSAPRRTRRCCARSTRKSRCAATPTSSRPRSSRLSDPCRRERGEEVGLAVERWWRRRRVCVGGALGSRCASNMAASVQRGRVCPGVGCTVVSGWECQMCDFGRPAMVFVWT